MSRNFFSDLLNLDSIVYWVKGTFLGGTWERLQNSKHGGSAIDPSKGRPARPGQGPPRPGQPPQAGMPPRPGQAPARPGQPQAGAPQRPGQAPARPGQPPQSQVQPQRPGVAPTLPNIPGMPPMPNASQVPGMQQVNQALGNLPPTRSSQEAQLMKTRAGNFFQENLSRSFDRIYTTIRTFLERGR
jgi:hypothetical protein